MKYLFIGGCVDGKRIELDPTSLPSFYRVPLETRSYATSLLGDIQQSGVMLAQTYQKTLFLGRQRTFIYVYEKLNDSDAIDLMILRYPAHLPQSAQR